MLLRYSIHFHSLQNLQSERLKTLNRSELFISQGLILNGTWVHLQSKFITAYLKASAAKDLWSGKSTGVAHGLSAGGQERLELNAELYMIHHSAVSESLACFQFNLFTVGKFNFGVYFMGSLHAFWSIGLQGVQISHLATYTVCASTKWIWSTIPTLLLAHVWIAELPNFCMLMFFCKEQSLCSLRGVNVL